MKMTKREKQFIIGGSIFTIAAGIYIVGIFSNDFLIPRANEPPIWPRP